MGQGGSLHGLGRPSDGHPGPDAHPRARRPGERGRCDGHIRRPADTSLEAGFLAHTGRTIDDTGTETGPATPEVVMEQ